MKRMLAVLIAAILVLPVMTGMVCAESALTDGTYSAEQQGFGGFPVCIAKTQYSLSPDQKALGRPTGFTFPVTDVTVRGGAGFVVVECGSVMLMPGLPKVPNAYKMTIDENGVIDGLS